MFNESNTVAAFIRDLLSGPQPFASQIAEPPTTYAVAGRVKRYLPGSWQLPGR